MTQIPVLTGMVPTGDARARAAEAVGDAAAPPSEATRPEATRPGAAWAAAWAQSVPRATVQASGGSGPEPGVARAVPAVADVPTIPGPPVETDAEAGAAASAGWSWAADPLILGVMPEAPRPADADSPPSALPGTADGALAVPVGSTATDAGQTRAVPDAAGQAALVAGAPTWGVVAASTAPLGPAAPATVASAGTPTAASGLWTTRAESRSQPVDAGPVQGKADLPAVVAGLQDTPGVAPRSPETIPEAVPGAALSTGVVAAGAPGRSVAPPDRPAAPRPGLADTAAGATSAAGTGYGTAPGLAAPDARTDTASPESASAGRAGAADAAPRTAAARGFGPVVGSGVGAAVGPAPGPDKSVLDPAAVAVSMGSEGAGAEPARSVLGGQAAGPGPAGPADGSGVPRGAALPSGAPVLAVARTGGPGDGLSAPPAAGAASAAAVVPGGLPGPVPGSEGGLVAGPGAASVAGVAAASGLNTSPGTRPRSGAPVPPADAPAVAGLAPARATAFTFPATATRPAEVPLPPESPRALRAREARMAEVPTAAAQPVATSVMAAPAIASRAASVSVAQARTVGAITEGLADTGMVRSDLPLATLPPGPEAPGAGPSPVRHGAPGSDAPDPRAIAAQLGEAFVSALPDGAVEISLRPEELGRVRLVLSPDAGGLTVTLAAERPETLDQMRRAIDTLAADLRDLGYAALNFRFDRSGHPGGRPSRPATDHATPAEIAPTTAADRAAAGMAAGLPLRATARLDIRL